VSPGSCIPLYDKPKNKFYLLDGQGDCGKHIYLGCYYTPTWILKKIKEIVKKYKLNDWYVFLNYGKVGLGGYVYEKDTKESNHAKK
jgi:hypothetical protein